MESCTYNHRTIRPQMFYITILRLSSRPILGLVGEADYSPISLHPPSGAARLFQWFGFFSFTMWVVQHLGLSEKYLGLRSVLEGSTDRFLPMFPGGIQRCPRACWFFRSSLWFPPSDFLGVFRPCLRVADHMTDLVWSRSCLLLTLVITAWPGIQNSWRVLYYLRMRVISWEVFYLTSCFLLSWQ